jgi:hypothetical protein
MFFYLIEQHSKFLLHTLQVLYMCAPFVILQTSARISTFPTIISNNPVCAVNKTGYIAASNLVVLTFRPLMSTRVDVPHR